MKFFNWMQNKFNGGQTNRKPNAVPISTSSYHMKQEKPKEEVRDWSQEFLTMGTLGNQKVPENQETRRRDNNLTTEIVHEEEEEEECSSPDLTEFTPEEVGLLQKELKKLLKRKPKAEVVENTCDLPLDRFLNCPSSLTVDRSVSSRYSTNSSSIVEKDEEDIDRTIRVIIGRCKEVCMENKKKGIGKKSVSFLLKKMFVCSGGFAPAPTLRDTFQESRMEKLLRTMLSKKMYPQNASRPSSTKRILEGRFSRAEKKDDEEQKRQKEGCKWVKTDSDYIVLDLD